MAMVSTRADARERRAPLTHTQLIQVSWSCSSISYYGQMNFLLNLDLTSGNASAQPIFGCFGQVENHLRRNVEVSRLRVRGEPSTHLSLIYLPSTSAKHASPPRTMRSRFSGRMCCGG